FLRLPGGPMFLQRTVVVAAAIAFGLVAAKPAHADFIPYPNSGSYNVTTYAFTAAASGDIVAYIVGGFGAGYVNQLGLPKNGVDTGIYWSDNHGSVFGDALNFGAVNAGDSLVFVLKNLTLLADQPGRQGYAYSNPALNVDYDDDYPLHN